MAGSKQTRAQKNRFEIDVAIQYLYGFEDHLLNVNTPDEVVNEGIDKMSKRLDNMIEKLMKLRDRL
jgi:hypothetical protein